MCDCVGIGIRLGSTQRFHMPLGVKSERERERERERRAERGLCEIMNKIIERSDFLALRSGKFV